MNVIEAQDHFYRLDRDRHLERALEAERALALHGRALREIKTYIDQELAPKQAPKDEKARLEREKQRFMAVRVLRGIVRIIEQHEEDLEKNRNAYRGPRWRGTQNGPRHLPPAA